MKCLLDHEGKFPGATLAKFFFLSRSVPRVLGRKAIPLVVCARNYRRASQHMWRQRECHLRRKKQSGPGPREE